MLADLAKLEAAIVSKNFTIEQLIKKQKRIVDELAQTKGKRQTFPGQLRMFRIHFPL